MFNEKIGTLTRISNTQVQLTGFSVLKLGGQQRVLTSPTLLTSVSGLGGIDTGAIAASSFYYVYAVFNGTLSGIVASLSAVSPTGFTRFKKVGAFYTDSGSLVFKAYAFGRIVKVTSGFKCNSTNNSFFDDDDGIVSGNVFSGTNTNTITFNTGIFSVTPNTANSTIFPGSQAGFAYSTAITTTTLTIISVTHTAALQAYGSQVLINRQGVDAIQPDWKDY